MNISLNSIPIIHDIPPQYLWIPPTASIIAYSFKLIFQRLFPLHQPDAYPLSTFRHNAVVTHFGYTRRNYPRYFTLLNVVFWDSIAITAFVIPIILLKKGNESILKDKCYLVFLCIMTCLLVYALRGFVTCTLKLLSHRLPSGRALLVVQKIFNLVALTRF